MDNPLSKVLTKAPPPPPLEVKIRTMRSDIDSMMKSGGGSPSFQNVAVSGLSMEGYKAPTSAPSPMPNVGSFSVPATPVVASAPVHAPASAATVEPGAPLLQNPGSAVTPPAASDPDPAALAFTPEPSSGNNLVPIIIVTIVAIGAIAVVGYFAYTIFAK